LIGANLLNFNSKENLYTTVFDRCAWDNIVYTLWLYGNDKVSRQFLTESLAKCRESLKNFYVI
jgi:hypothetical protein